MNVARIGLLFVAIAAAGGAAFLMRTMSADKGAVEAPPKEEAPKTEVLVAARLIDAGALVGPADFKWQAWPADALSPSFIVKTAAPDAPTELQGAMVRMPLDAGEPVTRTKVVAKGDQGFMAAMLNPGMRAVSVKISEETGAAGFILPGDRVDIIMTRKLSSDEEGGGAMKHDSKTVLRNVRVLAVGQTYKEGEGERTLLGKTATVELTPAQSELLALANAVGEITLALRSVGGGDITGSTGPQAGMLGTSSDGAIRVVRYSKTSRVMGEEPVRQGE